MSGADASQAAAAHRAGSRAAGPGAAVATLSGGLDSAAAVLLWQRSGGAVTLCLTFDYGQRAAARERDAAAAFCAARDLPWRDLALPWLGELAAAAGSALVDAAAALPQGSAAAPGDAASAASVWVPARNAVFAAIAAAHAEALGADAVLAGFNREEAATFPDNSAAFVAAGAAFLGLGTRGAVRLESPTLGLDKAGIVAAARQLGLRRDEVWSCYRGDAAPCGRCESCLRSARAWG